MAIGSRADLRTLNTLMGNVRWTTRAIREHCVFSPHRPLRLVELGAGDGTFILRVARGIAALGRHAELTLLDRQCSVSGQTLRSLAAMGWSTEMVTGDALKWLEGSSAGVDIICANLFLHHFHHRFLGQLLQLAAARTHLFIAREPERSAVALTAARRIGLIGCNEVTKHDAVKSVCAGFAGRELSALWPASGEWLVIEKTAGLFSHTFVAKRNG